MSSWRCVAQSNPVPMSRMHWLLAALVALLVVGGSARGQPASGDGVGSEPKAAPARPEGVDGADSTARPEPEPEPAEEPLRRRARQILELIDGTLDLEVEPASLFVVDLSDPALVGPAGEHLLELLGSLDEPIAEPEPEPIPPRRGRRRRSEPEPEPEPKPEPSAVDELIAALEVYLRLSPDERQEVFDRHARRQQAAVTERDAASLREARRVRVMRQADRLEAFLEGTLDLEVEPHDLLTLDLLDIEEVGLSAERRGGWAPPGPPANDDGASGVGRPEGNDDPPEGDATGGDTDEDPGSSGAPTPGDEQPAPSEPTTDDSPSPGDAPVAGTLEQAQARLDALRRRFLALPSGEQAALFEVHARRQRDAREAEAQAAAKAEAEAKAAALAAESEPTLDQEVVQQITDAEAEAEQAAANRERAEEDARRARSEADRILANERARLYDIQEAQANYEADVTRRKTERTENHDRALEWSQRVGALEAQSERGTLFGSELETQADGLYDQIRGELADTRRRLRTELQKVREAGAEVPRVGEGLDRELGLDIDRGVIGQLRQELSAKEQELIDLEQEVAWELAQGLRDDVVLLNRTRLALLEMASPQLHDEVTGFGPNGVDQVRRELDQISVELGFHVLKLPRYKDVLLEQLRASPVGVFLGTVQVLLVGLVYLWWRRRSPDLLVRARRWLFHRRPMPRWAVASITFLWFFDRIRRPFELLVMLWVLLRLAGNLDGLPELRLLWIIVSWILVGLTVILLVDALAARETRFSREVADSSTLRIHSLRVVGVNVIVIGMLLGLTSAMVGKGAIYGWVLSITWALIVPVVLYLVHRWRPTIHQRLEQLPEKGPFVDWAQARQKGAMRYLAASAGATYLLARGVGRWFMRRLSGRETTRRVLAYLFRREVAKRAAVAKAQPLEPVGAECYATFDPDLLEPRIVDTVGVAELDIISALVDSPRPTFSAVVGERGMGKTSFLRRLRERVGDERFKVVSCPEVGLEGLVPQIAALVGDSSLRDQALLRALRELGPTVIAIDDAQRLIQPAIRGLRELDRLIALARSAGGKISWVITIGSASWHYLQRARGDRVFFEQVLKLPRWSEEQLGELIRQRCEVAGITPSFEGLVVPRQADPMAENEDDRTESGYYRLLWDFSRGNPAVALHAFRESLFLSDQGETVVRLFKEPAAAEIEELSPPLLFVLRAVVQLDLAREHELTAATQLPATDVSDALRFCLARGYIEHHDAGVRITWPWYRTITTVLQRQHLLSSS
ncbi:MAG: AAA family ATPase [Nannocystaceae bacterium]